MKAWTPNSRKHLILSSAYECETKMGPTTYMMVPIWCFLLWATLVSGDGSPTSRIPTCPLTGWYCTQRAAVWNARASEGPLQNISLWYKTQEIEGGEVETVEVSCISMANASQGIYTEAMFQDFKLPSTIRFIKFRRCPMPTMPFRKILEPYVDRITALRFSSEESLPIFNWTLFQGFNNLRSVNLMQNGIQDIPEDLFDVVFPNITSFMLTTNAISTIPETLFRRNPNLVRIEFGANRLTALQKGLFQGLRNLEALLLYNNHLQVIEPGSFSDLTSLQMLDLQGNNLTVLPQGIFANQTNLMYLNLFSNRITELPQDLFASSPKLERVRIFDNPSLTSLPEKIFHGLAKLSILSLEKTSLQDLPKNLFKDLGNLTFLTLSNNKLRSLPEEIFMNNPRLTELYLDGNRLRTLPESVFMNQRSLKTLHLQNNEIEDITEASFVSLRKLETLSLANNTLQQIPYALLNYMPELHDLNMSNNMVSYSYKTDLEERGPFFMPSHINNVDLSHNRFQDLPVHFLLTTARLKSLDLSFNRMTEFSSENFQVAADGAVVNLTGNPLERIVFDMQLLMAMTLSYKPEVRNSLVFGSSPLFCDCHLEDFISYIPKQRDLTFPYVVDAKNLSCSGPPQLSNRPFLSLTMDELTCDIHDHCPQGCKCLFRATGHVQENICSNSGLKTLPWPVPQNTSILRMDHNYLGVLDSLPMDRWSNLSELYLNDANLTQITISELPPNLTKLALHGNQLNLLPEALLKNIDSLHGLTEVSLRDNPWSCECDEPSKNFKDWLYNNAKKVPQLTSVKCRQGGREAGVSVTMSLECPNTKRDMAIIVSCVVLAIAALCAITAVGYYRYGRSIKVWMYAHHMCLWFVTEKDLDSDKTYDGFVSFSQEDADFVANYLLPGLEQGVPRYKLCIHYRDWLAGEWIPDQIIRSVNESKRTIVVLSKHFIQSVWGRLEFRTAYHQALQDRTNRIIVVVVGEVPPESEMDPELRTYVKLNTYVKWGDPWFWKKLRYAMPHHTCFGPYTISSAVQHQQCVPTLSAISTASTTLSDWTPLPITSTGEKVELVISQMNGLMNNGKVVNDTTRIA